MQGSESALHVAALIGESFRADLLAAILGVDRLTALDALADHVSSGVVALDAFGGRFVDAAAFQQAYQTIPPSERVRLHERAAEVLIGWSEAGRRVDPAETARHLLASGIDARRAAQLFCSAGGVAMGRRDYATAEDYFNSAIQSLEAEADADPDGAVAWIGLGEARLARGDRSRARSAFEAAVEPARRGGRSDLLARAALGLGSGPTGFEVGLVDRVQLDLLEEALAALPDDAWSLRSRVLGRQAVALTGIEDQQPRRSMATEAVEVARTARDPAALGISLAALCDAVAGPEDVELRRRLADEIISVARSVADGELELLGRRHRLVALAETGDLAGVDAEIRDYAALAVVVGQPLYAWYVPLWRGMRALVGGRIEECRRWLEEAATIGAGAGSHNAFLLTATLRWCLLSEAADGDGIAALVEELERRGLGEEPGVWPAVALALMAAEAGRLAEARVRLDGVAPRLASAPRDSEWLPMLAQVAELVGHVGGHPVASWTYEALQPFAELFVVEGIAAATRGSVQRHLGLLSAVLGDEQQATAHFAAALESHGALGAPLLVARTQRDWGVALGNLQALKEAVAAYERLAVPGRVTELRAALGSEPAAEPDQARFVRDGDMWAVTFGGRTVRLRDAKGLRDLARLLRSPGRAVPALELATAGGARAPRRGADTEVLHQPGDLGAQLDSTARAAYQRRVRDLGEEIDEAEEFADHERAARAKMERDLLLDQLRSAYGLGGRPRRSGDPVERARTAVTARIRDAIGRIEGLHPELGRHLRLSVRTGTLCVYEPERPVPWTVA